jgi:hypothetical protein
MIMRMMCEHKMIMRMCSVGQHRIHIRCIYGIFGREITEYTVIYNVHMRLWPTLRMCHSHTQRCVAAAKLASSLAVLQVLTKERFQ